MVSHTPEPWRIEEGTTSIWGCCNSDDQSLYGLGYPITDVRITPLSLSPWCKGPYADEGEANTHRIVACVNALEGYNPEAVGDVVEALEALVGILHVYGVYLPSTGPMALAEYHHKIARAALARLEGAPS